MESDPMTTDENDVVTGEKNAPRFPKANNAALAMANCSDLLFSTTARLVCDNTIGMLIPPITEKIIYSVKECVHPSPVNPMARKRKPNGIVNLRIRLSKAPKTSR